MPSVSLCAPASAGVFTISKRFAGTVSGSPHKIG